MLKLIAAAALVPAAYITTTTLPRTETPLTPPGQTVGWGPNTGSSAWSQTGLGPSPYQGQPYGAGTPGAPNYPFIQAPSTDYSTYRSDDYIRNLNLQAFEQQANIVNQQLYTQWVAQGSTGSLPQYIGVDENAFNQWWAQYSANPGQDAPPQNFWTGLDPHNSFTSWIGTHGDGFTGALPSAEPNTSSASPPGSKSMPGSSTYIAATTTSTHNTPQSVKQAIEDAKDILSQDAAFVKDAQLQSEAAKVIAELMAVQLQE